jgi:hypothetical protein
MTITLRTAAAANYNTFDPGDSILQSVNLMAAYFECLALVLKAFKSYNQDNPDVLLVEPEVAKDDNTNTSSVSLTAPYRRAGADKKSLAYINSYSSWVTPTTGEFFENVAGGGDPIDNILDAMWYLAEAVDYGLSKIVPNVVIQDLKGLVTVSDDGSSRGITSTLPYNPSVSATGVEQTIPMNVMIFLDMQENLPF